MENETEQMMEKPSAEKGNNEVNGDVVNISQGSVEVVNAKNVTIRQGGIQKVTTENLVVRQGAVMNAKTDRLEMLQSGAGLIQTHHAHITASNMGAVVANGDVQMDQSATRILVARGEVTFDQGMSAVTVAQRVRMQNSGTIFLIAQNVEGDVKPMFGQRESILFGAFAGLIAGTIIMLGNLFRRRRS